jgi:hypothetical protein
MYDTGRILSFERELTDMKACVNEFNRLEQQIEQEGGQKVHVYPKPEKF